MRIPGIQDLPNQVFTPSVTRPLATLPGVKDMAPVEAEAQGYETQAANLHDTQTRSNYGTKDLVALGLAALAGDQGGAFLQGYMHGKELDQQRRIQQNQETDARARQRLQKQAADVRAAGQFGVNTDLKLRDDVVQNNAVIGRENVANIGANNKLSVEDKKDQLRRWVTNQTELDKKPYTYRAQWAMENLGLTDPDILERLAKPNTKELKDISSASNLDEKTKTIVALRPGQIKNLDNRNFYLASSSKLKDKQAITEVARATVLLPAQAALDMANAKAAVMNAKSRLKDVASMVDTRGKVIDQKRFDAASGQAAKAIQDATDLVGVAKDRVTTAQTEYGIVNSDKNATPEQKDLARQAWADASMFYKGVIDRKAELDKQYQELLKVGGIPILDVTEGFGGYGDPNGYSLTGKIGGGVSAATLRALADAQDAENQKKPPAGGTQKRKAKPAPPKGKSSHGTKYTVN